MDRFTRLETLFHAAAALPLSEREAFLKRQHDDDPSVLDEVRRLLHARSGAELRIESRLGSLPLPAGLAQFGPYRVLRLLGRGGMGAVYLAERADGEYDQRVALKVLSPHLAGDAFAARFRTERQLLAQMNHPNIVRLLDGGVGVTGEPYLVTEYIEGEPLDSYCDRHRLNVRNRLKLLLDVCGAVVHAHRNLVVHRDLKPGNVLVDASGIVKLLDFGTAKLLSSRDDSSVTTLPLLTPLYASPEQLRNAPLNISTDVYSLGLMMYELLAGHRAFDIPNDIVRELSRATDDLPLLPLGAKSTADASALRATTLGALRAELGGDLGAIAAKAVAYTQDRRYQSVEELRDDLLAYLDSRPVQARPVTLVYRASKFLFRRRYFVAAAAALLLVSTAGVVATVRQRNLAEARFDEVRSLARFQLFELYDQAERIPGTLRLRSQMAARSLAYLDGLAARKNLDPALAVEVAQGYRRLGDTQGNFAKATLGNPAEAIRLYQKGLALVEPFAARNQAAIRTRRELSASAAISSLSSNLGGEVLPDLIRLIAELQSALDANPADDEMRLLLGRASTAVFSAGQARGVPSQTVEEHGRKALSVLEQGAVHPGPLQSAFKLALIDLYRLRAVAIVDTRPAEARAWTQKGLRALDSLPRDLQSGSAARIAKASFLMTEAAASRAENDYRQALIAIDAPLAIIRELAADPDDLQACANLSLLLENRSLMRWDAEDYAGYVADLTEALPLSERLVKARAGRRFTLTYLSLLRGLAYGHDKLRTPAKEQYVRRAYEELKKATGDTSLGFKPNSDLADLLLNIGLDGEPRPDEALRYAEAAAKLDPGAMNAWETVAEANRQLGRYSEALAAIDRALATIEPPKPGEPPTQFYLSLQRRQRQIIQESSARKPRP